MQQDAANDLYIHESCYVDQPCTIGRGTRIWHFCHIMENSIIGENCRIGQNVVVSSGVKIGNNVKIQNNVSVYTGVILEDDVFCGPSVVFTNVVTPRSSYPRNSPDHYAKTCVMQGATLGANSTIVCGHTIGRHAFIGAGAVVTADIPDYALAYGNPARVRGWVCECGIKLEIEGDVSTCQDCSKQYRKSDGKLERTK